MSDLTSTKRKLARPRSSIMLASAMFVGAAAIGFGSLYAMGVPFFGNGPVAVVAEEQEVMLPVVSTKGTTAEKVLTALIKDPSKGWVPRGSSIRQASNPLPYSCPASDTAASLSIGHAYMVGGSSVQVVATAHGAGLGAEALSLMSQRAYSCASGRTTLTHWAEQGVGTQAFSSIAGGTRTTALRRGDVILYVTGDRNAPTKALAQQLDNRLIELAETVCKNPESTAAHASRNLMSTAGYEPFRVTKKLSVKDPGLPVIDPDAEYEALDLREPLPDAPEAATPEQAPTWPVWPDMPEPVELPVVPTTPEPEAPTKGSIKALAEDVDGPGCGWDFTGSAIPVFDEEAADQENTAAINTKLTELSTLVDQWQEKVLKYWGDADAYAQAHQKYEKYSQSVSQVNGAWREIAIQWEAYRQSKATWDANVLAAEELRTKQAEALTKHTEQLAQCKADNDAYVPPVEPVEPVEPSETPDEPAPTPDEPDAEPTPTMDQETGNAPEPVFPVDCAAAFPSPDILTKVPVDPGPEPTEPADPRPANEPAPVKEPGA